MTSTYTSILRIFSAIGGLFWQSTFRITSLPNGQKWLIDRMQAMGYKVSGVYREELGLCAGVAHKGMHAFLANELDSFIRLL